MTKLYAVSWSPALTSLTFLAEWESGQFTWVPFLALGPELPDCTLYSAAGFWADWQTNTKYWWQQTPPGQPLTPPSGVKILDDDNDIVKNSIYTKNNYGGGLG